MLFVFLFLFLVLVKSFSFLFPFIFIHLLIYFFVVTPFIHSVSIIITSHVPNNLTNLINNHIIHLKSYFILINNWCSMSLISFLSIFSSFSHFHSLHHHVEILCVELICHLLFPSYLVVIIVLVLIHLLSVSLLFLIIIITIIFILILITIINITFLFTLILQGPECKRFHSFPIYLLQNPKKAKNLFSS